MKKSSLTQWVETGISLVLSIIMLLAFNITFAAGPEPAVPPSGSSSGGTTSTGAKVVQPPIIPGGSTTQQKLYLPHDTAGDTNKDYLQQRLLPGIASTIIGLAGGLSLLFVIISGIRLLTAYSDPETADKAKKTLTYALAGVVIASLSYAIVAIIASIGWTPPPPTK